MRNRRRRRGRRSREVNPENVLTGDELDAFLRRAQARFPFDFPFILFMADTGARIGEASALRWADVDLHAGKARICRSFSSGKHLMESTKTGVSRSIELSGRLRHELELRRPDLFGPDTLVFPTREGGFRNPKNFRSRTFDKLVEDVLGADRGLTPHGLRHTFATLHLARGTNPKWVQAQGGWESASMLWDTYGHFLPDETTGYADALTNVSERHLAAPAVAAGQADRERPSERVDTSPVAPGTSTPPRPWARPDSNGGPPACKAGALAN